LPPIVQLVVGIAVVVGVIWFSVAAYHSIASHVDVWVDNYKDQQLQKKDAEIEAVKQANNKQISVLEADNIKLKAERDALDKENQIFKAAIANDGKVVASEQKKIDEAHKKYNETKDSCTSATDADAYVQCVCTKLGVACD